VWKVGLTVPIAGLTIIVSFEEKKRNKEKRENEKELQTFFIHSMY
jgi:hypothetical protein